MEGRAFHVGALRELLPDDERPGLETTILGLVRTQLIEPERPEFAGEDAFRFAHALIRDAAYEGTPKALRAELHERLADWLEATPGALDEMRRVLRPTGTIGVATWENLLDNRWQWEGALLREVAELTAAGIGLEGVKRILELENQVAALRARNAELRQRSAQLEAALDAAVGALRERRPNLPALRPDPPSWMG